MNHLFIPTLFFEIKSRWFDVELTSYQYGVCKNINTDDVAALGR